MGKIESQSVWRHQRPGLLDVWAQHIAQRGVQQMGAGMVGFDSAAALVVYSTIDNVANTQHSAVYSDSVDVVARYGSIRVFNARQRSVALEPPGIADLAAGLRIEWSAVEQNFTRLALFQLLAL
jgi:hypothetical protein